MSMTNTGNDSYRLPQDLLLKTFTFIEGLSLLVLLLIAMPLKYVFDMPMAVKFVGWAHGVLFIGLMALILRYCIKIPNKTLSLKVGIILFIASLIPFGWILADKRVFEQP